MVLERKKLREIIKDRNVKTTEDFQDLMRDMVKDVIEAVYEGELTSHLGYEKNGKKTNATSNSRNGYGDKTVKTAYGKIELNPPRDREGKFEPEIVKKRQKDITGMEEKIISMYAKGMTTRDISAHINSIYGHELSAGMISNITDSVLEKAKEWQFRPLESIYAVVFMDAIVIKQKCEGIVKNTAIYGLIGIDLFGNKECLGLYITEDAESSKYWLTVLNELKQRGVKDILIFAVDNLNGISEAIQSAFSKAEIQKCIVHQIRNSLKFVSWKERKEVANDLKTIYTAINADEGFSKLEQFAEKWDKKYPYISKSWYNNWSELSVFYKYSSDLRRLIYTTNPIESFNRGLRKVSKNKAIFPTGESITKLFYLAVQDIQKRWTQRIREWGQIYSQLWIYFEERLEKFEL